MKHARTDYDRIQDPAGLIPEDEPVFLLRGQDPAAPIVLRVYANCARALEAHTIATGADRQADRMEDWQRTTKRKVPDMPAGALADVDAPVSTAIARIDSADHMDHKKILAAFVAFAYSDVGLYSFSDINVFDRYFSDLNCAERSFLLNLIQSAKP